MSNAKSGPAPLTQDQILAMSHLDARRDTADRAIEAHSLRAIAQRGAAPQDHSRANGPKQRPAAQSPAEAAKMADARSTAKAKPAPTKLRGNRPDQNPPY